MMSSVFAGFNLSILDDYNAQLMLKIPQKYRFCDNISETMQLKHMLVKCMHHLKSHITELLIISVALKSMQKC